MRKRRAFSISHGGEVGERLQVLQVVAREVAEIALPLMLRTPRILSLLQRYREGDLMSFLLAATRTSSP